jgi:hypothetical protein
MLSTADIICRKRVTIANNGVHDRIHLLPSLVRVGKAEHMSKLMERDALDISYCIPIRAETQWAPIGIELLVCVEQDIGFGHDRA